MYLDDFDVYVCKLLGLFPLVLYIRLPIISETMQYNCTHRLKPYHSSHDYRGIYHVFIQNMEWQLKETMGTPPLGVCDCGFTVVDKRLMVYGGYSRSGRRLQNSLHELDMATLQWNKLAPSNAKGAPMKKSDSGVVAFSSDGEEQLYIFAGFGKLKSYTFQPGAEYVNLANCPDYGCTNELHCFTSGKHRAYICGYFKNIFS